MIKNMKQKQTKLSQTGSFINWMMSSNSSIPEIGMGATELHWSDRSPWEVIAIDNDGKGCTIRQMEVTAHPDAHKIGMGHQAWILTSNEQGHTRKLRWRHNAWKHKSERYYLSDLYWEHRQNARDTMDDREFSEWLEKYNKEQAHLYPEYFEHHTEWHQMKIIFGKAEYYYDWSF